MFAIDFQMTQIWLNSGKKNISFIVKATVFYLMKRIVLSVLSGHSHSQRL